MIHDIDCFIRFQYLIDKLKYFVKKIKKIYGNTSKLMFLSSFSKEDIKMKIN
jgi:hypothetical protein